MKFSKLILAAVLTFSLIIPAFAAERSASIKELMDKSGMTNQLGSMVESALSSFEQIRTAVPEEARDQIKKSYAKAYNIGRLTQAIAKSLEENLTDADIKGTLEWLNSPLGRKITQLEEKASTAQGTQDIVEFMKHPSEISDDRQNLIQRLDSVIHGTEMAVEMYMNSMVTMTTAMHSVINDPNKLPLDQMIKGAESARPEIEAQMEQSVFGSSLYMYQSLTDEELEKYIKFYESEVGTRYSTYSIKALIDSFSDSNKELGADIGRLVNEKVAKDAQAVGSKTEIK